MKQKYGYIYKLESPSGKIYIGKTFNLKKRFSEYKCLNCKNQKMLYHSLKKYGFDNHVVTILKEGLIFDKTLAEYEIYFIKKFNSFENGMNLTLGGEGVLGYKPSEESIQKMIKTRKSRPKTQKELDAIQRMYGRKIKKSKQWIENNSKARMKKIIQYNLDGTFVREWDGAIQIEKELGICRKSISNNVRGVTKFSYGFIWKFKSDDTPIEVVTKIKGIKRKVIDLETNIIYDSIKEFGEAVGINPKLVANRLRSKNRVEKFKIDYYGENQ